MPIPPNSDSSRYRTKGRSVVPRIFSQTRVVGFDPCFYVRYLKPVNGLLGIIQFSGIRMHNISTRQTTPLISSIFAKEKNTDHRSFPVYQFGFDPATKEHKVICIWTLYNKEKQGSACVGGEVLTVGENSTWKIIDDRVPDNYHIVEEASVYANGSVYWITAEFLNSHNSEEEKVIVAFDVGHEKFRKVIVPKSATLDCDLHTGWWSYPSVVLLEVNDRLALLCRQRDRSTVKLWLLDGTGGIGSCIQTWTELTINLPFQWDIARWVEFLPIPGTEEILMESYEKPGVYYQGTTRIPFLSLHSYNWKSMTSKEEETIELHSSIPVIRHERGIRFISSAYFESLFPIPKKW